MRTYRTRTAAHPSHQMVGRKSRVQVGRLLPRAQVL